MTFNIDTLKVLIPYNISIYDSVKCDPSASNLRDVICIEALLDGEGSCNDSNPLWDKSEITLSAICEDNKIQFIIYIYFIRLL